MTNEQAETIRNARRILTDVSESSLSDRLNSSASTDFRLIDIVQIDFK